MQVVQIKMGERKILIPSASSVVIRIRCVSGVGYLLISTGTSQFRVVSTQDEENLPGKNDMSERGMWNVYFRICGVFYFHISIFAILFALSVSSVAVFGCVRWCKCTYVLEGGFPSII